MIAEAIPDKKAITVAEVILRQIFLKHGCPEQLRTDCGSEFCNNTLDVLLLTLKIQHITSFPRASWTNGQIEACNKVLFNMLTKAVEQCPSQWDEFIDCVVFSYNSTPNTVTRLTPFFLMTGSDARFPSALLWEPVGLRYSEGEFPVRAENRLKMAYRIVQEFNAKAIKEQAKYYDRHSKEYKYKIEDLIFIKSFVFVKEISPKLQKVWTGPYRITAFNNPVIAIVSALNNPSKIVRCHLRHCKPAYIRDQDQPSVFQGVDDLELARELGISLTEMERRIEKRANELLLADHDTPSEVPLSEELGGSGEASNSASDQARSSEHKDRAAKASDKPEALTAHDANGSAQLKLDFTADRQKRRRADLR